MGMGSEEEFSPPLPTHVLNLLEDSQVRLEPLVTGEEKRLWGPIGQGIPAHPPPHLLLPVVVLADASHCTQGLQVVVGLAGAQAVQGLAAPWVPGPHSTRQNLCKKAQSPK